MAPRRYTKSPSATNDDPSDGGLAVALAECTVRAERPHLGGRFDLPGGLRGDVLIFSESPARAVVTTRDDLRMAELARRHGVPWARIGAVGGDRLVLSSGGQTLVDLPLTALHEAWTSLERTLGEPALAR